MGIEADNPGNGYSGTRLFNIMYAITRVSKKRVKYPGTHLYKSRFFACSTYDNSSMFNQVKEIQ